MCVSGPRHFVRDVHLSHRAHRPFAFLPFPLRFSLPPPLPSSLCVLSSSRSTYSAHTHTHICTHMRFKYTQKLCLSFHGSLLSPFLSFSQPSLPFSLFYLALLAHHPMISPYYLQRYVHPRGENAISDKKQREMKAARKRNFVRRGLFRREDSYAHRTSYNIAMIVTVFN